MANQKTWKDKYKEIMKIGKGCNAKVYRVKSKSDTKNYALKDLNTRTKEKMGRFIDEINVAKDNYNKIEGIMPIIEFSINEYWYTMPIAELALQYIVKNKIDIKRTIEYVIQLCETLEFLHEKDISHRDIKPKNIYFFNDRFYIGDFGLVEFPNKINDFTKSDRSLGAIFTIAPEMKRNPKTANGKKADVFSLAKTLWMFLTKDEKGFDGVYNYLDPTHSLRYIDKYMNTHLVELDELLKDATDNSPDNRPTINEFKDRLINWIDIYSDIDKSQASDWNFLNKQLFGLNPPESSSWRNSSEIIKVLNIVGKTPAYNHMLFPEGGGLDFYRAEIASENNCIKLYDTIGSCYLVKPKALYFEGFGENFKWNYFLLESDGLKPVLGTGKDYDYEYLVEDFPANYVSAKYAQYGVYDYDSGEKLPDGHQRLYRYIRGKFLIVMKKGPYNKINGTYDGRHDDCENYEFKNYICNLIKEYEKVYDYAKQHDDLMLLSDEEIENGILHLKEFNKNPFRNDVSVNDDNVEMNERFLEQQKSRDYIKCNFASWNLRDIIIGYESSVSTKMKFIFKFRLPDSELSIESLTRETNYICDDGKINLCVNGQRYCVYDRKTANDMKNKLVKKVSDILRENNLLELNDSANLFAIELVRIGKPVHLFTKQEIEEEMRIADDRCNNQLIIDEDGYAKVIKNEDIGYLFPVMHETWLAGNMYVGRYSKLSTLEENYISSLQGWCYI